MRSSTRSDAVDDFLFALQWIPIAYSELGSNDEAIATARKAATLYPHSRSNLGFVLAKAGILLKQRAGCPAIE
jgi:hypothetical protein